MKRILFVDDERNVLDGIRRMLHSSRSRWQMHFADSGAAALALFREDPFDIVVSDLRMPGMDGAALLGQIRREFPAAARIILSGYSDVDLTLRAVPVAYRVLTKPCNAEALIASIERVCALQDVLCTSPLRDVIGTIGELPSLSNTYLRLNEMMQEPGAAVTDVASLIQQDIAMSAKVLQLVNSGFFGLPHNVVSLEHAVAYLGSDTIRMLALHSETFRVFRPDARIPGLLCETMQEHSQRVATVARSLPLTHETKDLCVMAAVLHDVGKLVLASTMPREFSEIVAAAAQTQMSLVETEEHHLGTSHAEVGAYLLGLWGIHSVVVEAIAHHHHPTRINHNGLDCSAALYLSNVIANHFESCPDHPVEANLNDLTRDNLEKMGLMAEYSSFTQTAASVLRR